MTPEQQDAIDRLARENGGRVAVKEGFADHTVEVTLLSLANFRVSEDGVPHPAGINTAAWRDYDLELV